MGSENVVRPAGTIASQDEIQQWLDLRARVNLFDTSNSIPPIRGVVLDTVQTAFGWTIGTDHVRRSVNNQDGISVSRGLTAIAGVVCDGCGSGPDSEVGALLGAKLFSKRIVELADRYVPALVASPNPNDYVFWSHIFDKVRDDVLAHLRVIGNAMGDSMTEIASRYFLFTVVGFVITPRVAIVFAAGDGTYVVARTDRSSQTYRLGPFPKNAPPYIGYGLLGQPIPMTIHTLEPAATIRAVVVGTDGFDDYLDASDQKKCYPGTSKLVGPVSDIWTCDTYFENPDALRRTLALMNKPKQWIDYERKVIDRESGLLRDDTSIVVARVKG